MMDLYDIRFTVRFMVGGAGGMAGMTLCMWYGFAVSGDGSLVVFSVLPFVCTLLFFGEVRLRPFREFRKGLRVSVPGWDWGRDIATSAVAGTIAAGVWLGVIAAMADLDLLHDTWAMLVAGGFIGGAAYGLSRAVCRPLGLFPPPLKPGWGE